MPNRLVSEIPAGPPGVVHGKLEGMFVSKRLSSEDPRLAG
jgi:hypothetical protein